MKIYLLYEEHYDYQFEMYDSVTVYPYKSMDGIIQRLIDECGLSKESIIEDLKDNIITTPNFYYRLEETELLD